MASRRYAEVCEEVCTHPDILNRVKPEMPDEERLYDLAELFKVFGDTTRIRILYVLFESEMCVCDIAALLNMTQSAISHQLRIPEAGPPGPQPPGREDRLLLFGRRPRPHRHRPGHGAHRRKAWEEKSMKKTYKIDVDCANCANLMEEAAKATPGVQDAVVSFMTLKMKVTFEEGADEAAVMAEVLKNCKKAEPDCEIYL